MLGFSGLARNICISFPSVLLDWRLGLSSRADAGLLNHVESKDNPRYLSKTSKGLPLNTVYHVISRWHCPFTFHNIFIFVVVRESCPASSSRRALTWA